MTSLTDCYKLNNGIEIPCVGFGTWQTPSGDIAKKSVIDAIEAGYRHIDTAAAYRNEQSVGEGIRKSGVPRKNLFIASKLANLSHGYEETKAAFEQTLSDLGCRYLDLYLIHWPNPAKFRDCWQEANAGTWKAFEEFYKSGKIRAIGISNFLRHHIDALMETAEIAPMVNQIRLCPGETQEETVAYCRSKGMFLEAYSPLGTGKVFEVPEMKEFAAKYNRSVAQICIRWSLQMGFIPLPKSVSADRIRENADVFGFTLSDEDVKIISALEDFGKTVHPDHTLF